MNRSTNNQHRVSQTLLYRAMSLMYSLVWYILILPLAILFAVKMLIGKAGYSRDRLSRLGLFRPDLTRSTLLWHCVSVGEVVCITPLIHKLLDATPNLSITITTTTATGAAQVQKAFGDRVQHCYLPYDCGLLMRRLLNRIQPRALLITEVELWPNLINIASTKNIPIALINARMTDRSAANYAKLGRFFTGTVQQIQMISAQSARDKENYERLGVSPSQIKNSGNIKFELTDRSSKDEVLERLAIAVHERNKLIIVAASTHEPEESMIIAAHKQLAASGLDLQTWLVPRHPQRFERVASLIENANIDYLRYSHLTGQETITNTPQILLIDAMGVLNAAFAHSDMAFIGGSFAEKGGHNALEAALFKKPVVMGPSQFNNPEIYHQLHAANNLITASDQSELEDVLRDWCENTEKRLAAGTAGYAVIQTNRGALTANQLLIEALIESTND